MCEICTVERGDSEILVCESVEVTIGKRKLEKQKLEFLIGQDKEGKYKFYSTYFIDGGDPIAEICIPIQYCPFCGRSLTNK